MQFLFEQTLAGLANGAIYALMALALTLVYQCTRFLNLAQGEIATWSSFAALQLMA